MDSSFGIEPGEETLAIHRFLLRITTTVATLAELLAFGLMSGFLLLPLSDLAGRIGLSLRFDVMAPVYCFLASLPCSLVAIVLSRWNARLCTKPNTWKMQTQGMTIVLMGQVLFLLVLIWFAKSMQAMFPA